MYTLRKLHHSEVGQLMGVACERTHTRVTDQCPGRFWKTTTYKTATNTIISRETL